MLAPDTLLQVSDLRTYFRVGGGLVRSVDGVDLSVNRGKTLAIVGESGSGKSVTSLSIMRLIQSPPGYFAGGQILFRDRANEVHSLLDLPLATMQRIRGREISMVFQEPMSSLNPVFTVGEQIAESLMLHEGMSRTAAMAQAVRLLELVEIPSAATRVRDYPHQLSGGMRQRVMIAIALACSPALLIADEPTTALDVTIQAQILDLMRKLQRELVMSMLFITHNLGVVAEIADEVAVMYAGKVVEQASVEALFERPHHPYTQALLQSLPRMDLRRVSAEAATTNKRLKSIPGAMPMAGIQLPGCAFAPRCAHAQVNCTAALPPLVKLDQGHLSRCILPADTATPLELAYVK